MFRGPMMVCSLLCMTGRDLQKMSGNSTAKVGHWTTDEIKALRTRFQLSKRVQNEEVPMAEEALAMISQSFRQVVLDVKVGPPSFEKGLAEDILSLVGYVVMVDKFTNRRTELVRIEGAKVAGIYHPLIHEKVMKVMRRHDRRVFAWTVDDSSSMKKMLYEHVDAIVTSNPSLLQQLMQETRAECMEDGFALP
uniref:glycerophosphodiester phosphodiesterase n=1 Tax=Zea mays TaxID=4577 RepID=A0A804NKQ5_MAIZE